MTEVKRDYQTSDSHLIVKGNIVLNAIDRDDTEFSTRGWSPAKRAKFKQALDDFDALPADTLYRSLQRNKGEIAAAAEVILKNKLTILDSMAVNKFGRGSAMHLAIIPKPVSSVSGEELYSYTDIVLYNANVYLTELADEGLTTAFLTDSQTVFRDFKDKYLAFHTAKSNRRIATKQRIVKGNAFYAELTHWCATGKIIWKNDSTPQYDDYVIYDTPTGIKNDMTHLTPAPGEVLDAVHSGIGQGSEIEISTDTEVILWASDTKNPNAPTVGTKVIPAGTKKLKIKVDDIADTPDFNRIMIANNQNRTANVTIEVTVPVANHAAETS